MRPTIAFIGGGTMTRSLVQGLIKCHYPLESMIVSSRGQEKLTELSKDFGIPIASSNVEAVGLAHTIILAVKPHFIKEVCQEIAPFIQEGAMIISLAAAIRIEDILAWIGRDCAVVRTMTNLPISIGMGVCAMFANSFVNAEQIQFTENLFNTVGTSFWVAQEIDLNTLTPLIGSGPAYLYLLMETLQDAAIKEGLDAALVEKISKEIMLGAAALATQSTVTVDALRQSVTTPNGVTAAALEPLLKDELLSKLLQRSYHQANLRCKEMEAARKP